jgi:alginate O-acetyltransferase complex protein AlgI
MVYGAGILICREHRNKKTILKLIVIWLIANLCFFKYAHPLFTAISELGARFFWAPKVVFPAIILPLGLSYITFRLIHYIVEVYRHNTPQGSFVDFALYILFFPTFLAGPVDRFQRFHPQIKATGTFNIDHINYGLFRIICGLIRKIIIADNLRAVVMPVLISPQSYSRTITIVAMYGLAIQVYMDFSGYTDMAIGVARLFGYRIMENFDRPYLKKNIALFWRSWHISVYSWIRDYFFFPVFGPKASKQKLYWGIILTMLVFHVWHNLSLSFLVLGLYHGLGLLAWQLFQEAKKRAAKIKHILGHKYLEPVAVFVTFSFVSFGTIFLIMDFKGALQVISRINIF